MIKRVRDEGPKQGKDGFVCICMIGDPKDEWRNTKGPR